MTINCTNGVNVLAGQIGMNQAADSYSKNIQNQISNAQKQLQELSSNEDMTMEEKMKKRQELQQQINDLNTQLRQHKMELRRGAMGISQRQQNNGSSMNAMLGGTKSGSNSAGLSQASMNAVISAGNSMKQARVQGSVAKRMEGKASVLKAEIKSDEALGGSAEKKKEELADLEQKAQAAAESQFSSLADVNRTIEEEAKEEKAAEKTKDKKTDKTEDKDSGTQAKEQEKEDTQSTSETKAHKEVSYTSIDIQL